MNILLPIETINRELDFKLTLAALLKDEERSIFIGQHDFLIQLLSEMKNGIYIGKNIFHKRADIEKGEIYTELKNKGFDIIYLHEEGAVFKGNAENWKKVLSSQYNLDFFDQNDVICDWGNFQKSYDESRSENLNIEVTGHPRFDLYKENWSGYFQKEQDELKNKYGNYILINGNYGLYNHGLGINHIFSEKGNYIVENEKNRMERVSFYHYSGVQCLAMIELTHKLALKYPNKNIIYRPHPSESQAYYETIFKGVSNIHVNHEGSVSAWILAADAIIHDGCTTAVEASIAGKPVINFKPIYNAENDIWLPNQLGTQCTTFEEVMNVLENLSNYYFDIDKIEKKELLKDLMYNFENDSFEKFLQVINEKIQTRNDEKFLKPSDGFIQNKYLKLNLKGKLYRLKDSKSRKASDYHNRKFYGFDKNYVEEKMKVLEKMLSKEIKIKYHNPYLIEIR